MAVTMVEGRSRGIYPSPATSTTVACAAETPYITQTLRINNSSRHGKYLEIMFNEQGEPVGAQITNYLLEKGRVVGQMENERDFHVFYQFTKGDEQRGKQAVLHISFP
ncbi:myosin head-domain-containing protein [Gautieria morchelliformis]|nr:myosin head-domain-containing protein [Gautieria morchelliformis]